MSTAGGDVAAGPVPGRIRTWSLRGRIAAALSAAGVLLLVVVAAAGVLVAQAYDAQQTVVSRYYQALKTSQDNFIAMLDSETAVRGYALSKDPDNLAPLRAAEQPWNADLVSEVRREVPDQTVSLQALDRYQQARAAWYREWAAPAIADVGDGGTITPDRVAAGTALFDQVRSSYQEYIRSLRSGREAAADRLRQFTTLLFEATLVIAVIAAGTALTLWVLLRRWVTRPVGRLAAETRLVSAGDLNHEVVVGDGPPEFVELATAVETMRAGIVEQLARVETAHRRVEEGQERLERQTEELRRSNQELEQFAYVASHDLQEPLRKVASFCQLLERRYGEVVDERGKQYIHFAVDGAQRMQQLINDLLDFSRVGRIAAPTTQVDTGAAARRAVANLETAIGEAGAEVRIGELPTLPGEAGLLTQVFQNVVGNAVKFRSDAPPVVELDAVRHGDEWEFRCADNGIGIPQEYADRVFLIFQRLHPKEVYSGTGIGLSMCRKIVEYHGGRIWVDRTAPAGTTIRWTLPATGTGPTPVDAGDEDAGADLEPAHAHP